jgi:alkylation response protein AidB-like acyl-CoA dehydrogenase
MTDLLDLLARTSVDTTPVPSLAAWLDRLDGLDRPDRPDRPERLETPFTDTIDCAAWAGFHADRLGYAFVGGYEAALRRLVGGQPGRGRRCLAATEAGGAHPRAIATKLEGGVLRGEKTFATLASVADELLVIASTGASADGKNALVLVRVPRDAPGLRIVDRPPTPFAPEIPHATVTFDDFAVDPGAVLAGDGYTR